MAQMFSFRAECIHKYDEELYDLCMEVFDTLPICGIVGRDYLCSHAGFGPGFTGINEVNKINRFVEIPEEGVICDIVWADPAEDEDAQETEFEMNKDRRISFKYGLKPVQNVLKNTGTLILVRAH